MTRRVWACGDCGEEAARDVETCSMCGGAIEEVDRLFVALADALEAIEQSRLT